MTRPPSKKPTSREALACEFGGEEAVIPSLLRFLGPHAGDTGKLTVLDHKTRDGFPGFTELRLVGVPVEE